MSGYTPGPHEHLIPRRECQCEFKRGDMGENVLVVCDECKERDARDKAAIKQPSWWRP